MFNNSNFVGQKDIKDTKSLPYGLLCYVQINIKICILGIEFTSKGDKDPECSHGPKLALEEVNSYNFLSGNLLFFFLLSYFAILNGFKR